MELLELIAATMRTEIIVENYFGKTVNLCNYWSLLLQQCEQRSLLKTILEKLCIYVTVGAYCCNNVNRDHC
jgi:hypothetical protein